MNDILPSIIAYISAHHEALLALIGGAGALSAAIQWFLHRFKISGAVVSFIISHLFAIATAAATYILSSVHPDAGSTWGWLWIAAQFWHRLVINPAYNAYVIPFLDWLAKQKNATTPEPALATAPAATPTGTWGEDSLE